MISFLNVFDKAFEKYKNQDTRPGYTIGWFTWLRHKRTLYSHIQALRDALDKAKDTESAKEVLKTYFNSSRTAFNNHSFSVYLIDELAKKFPSEEWEKFYPKNKQIVFYNGKLYRGSLQPYEDAFRFGMNNSYSDNIEDYVKSTNWNIGVSTSRSKSVAKEYRITVHPTGDGTSAYVMTGNLFKINYRGNGAVNIQETLLQRGRTWLAKMVGFKDEVNVIHHIPNTDIVCAWDNQDKRHDNPFYQPIKSIDAPTTFKLRREQLFGVPPVLTYRSESTLSSQKQDLIFILDQHIARLEKEKTQPWFLHFHLNRKVNKLEELKYLKAAIINNQDDPIQKSVTDTETYFTARKGHSDLRKGWTSLIAKDLNVFIKEERSLHNEGQIERADLSCQPR